MTATKQFTITRTFDAPRAAVWRAWTDPTIAAQWWDPHGMTTPRDSVEIDLREGGRFAYTMVLDETGETYPTGGEYLEVREPERLRFTWADPGATREAAPVITIDLVETAEGGCEMTFHLSGVDEDRVSEQSVFHGWTEAFEQLGDALATTSERSSRAATLESTVAHPAGHVATEHAVEGGGR